LNAGGGTFNGSTAATAYTVTSALGGTGGLTKAGPGTLVLNGTTTANTPVSPTLYSLTSPDFSAFSGTTLMIDATGTYLVLSFTPVPEPGVCLVLATGGAVACRLFHRRRGSHAGIRGGETLST
jgi:hypothetical protein